MGERTGYHHPAGRDLTARQREVLALIAEGKTNVEIAAALGIGFESAKSHVSTVLAKLGVASRDEAGTAWAEMEPPDTKRKPGRGSARGRGFGPALAMRVALGIGAAVAITVAIAAAAVVRTFEGEPNGPLQGHAVDAIAPATEPRPAGPQPDATADWEYQPGTMSDARMDLARRIGVDSLEITIWNMTEQAWDACVGIYHSASQGCNQPLVIGDIVQFRAGALLYQYNLDGERFVAMDWAADVVLADGAFPAFLDQYGPPHEVSFRNAIAFARGDVAYRTGTAPDEWPVIAMAPVTFADGCLGFERQPAVACRPGEQRGYVMDFERAGVRHRYHVSRAGVVAIDFEPGTPTLAPDPAVLALQERIRANLAMRLSTGIDDVAVVDFVWVVWPDSCLAIWYPGESCEAGEVDGYLASFEANGHLWDYRGRDTGEFVPGAPVSDENAGAGTYLRLQD